MSRTTVGSATFSARITNNLDKWQKLEVMNLRNAQRAMCDSILNGARMIAPKKTGELRANGRVEQQGDTMAVAFGDGTIPYARYQEFGSPQWHFTTPGTGPHYLKQAGDSVTKKGISEYL